MGSLTNAVVPLPREKKKKKILAGKNFWTT
jgi:hypothetical protein